jgi:NADH:ubiquinone oxidoreductase subunit 5 (subunit L)/multisubunit Na+/H+ antiporter MnhA subunit
VTTVEILAALVPLAPLAAAGTIGAMRMLRPAQGDGAERPTAALASAAALVSLLAMLALSGHALAYGAPGAIEFGHWFSAGRFALPLSLLLDAKSLAFGTLVAAIGFLTLRFAVHYMHRESGFHRFFFALCLFCGGMLGIVLAGNAALCFVGWEVAGLSSYLLIGFAHERPAAADNALRAFVTNRVGDAGFVVGLAAALYWVGGFDWTTMGRSAARLDTLAAGMLALGFVVAALAKSAQVPFSPWIARALEGPTPSSAIFYGSIMVHAGVWLLIRSEPVLVQAPALMALIAALGLLSALHGWLAGLTQSDVKSALTFATTTQVGLMFLACGLGWFDLAAWHLGLHASWRAWQFLHAPSYMHLMDAASTPAPGWLRRRRRLYLAAHARFWLEPAGDWLLVRPTRGLGRDMNALDEQVVSRIAGAAQDPAPVQDAVIRGHGAGGRALEAIAAALASFERRLVLQGPGGTLARALARIGRTLQAIETLLERPRYLLLLIMATFAVIL